MKPRGWYAVAPSYAYQIFGYYNDGIGKTLVVHGMTALPARDAIRFIQADIDIDFAKALNNVKHFNILTEHRLKTLTKARLEALAGSTDSKAIIIAAISAGITDEVITQTNLIDVFKYRSVFEDWQNSLYDGLLSDLLLACHEDPRRVSYFKTGIRDIDLIDKLITNGIDPDVASAL